MSSIIDIRNLDFGYDRQKVLCGVDLAVQAGTTLGIIGPNGGGKTTLIHLLIGLLKPDRGQIIVDGHSPKQAIRRGNIIGYLPQNASFESRFPITLRELVKLGLAGKTGIFQSYQKSDLQFVETLINRVGIIEIADKSVCEVSGGQLQRALIARALAPKPKILILDEPTTGIDPKGQRDFVELIQQLKTDLGLTIIFVSHDLRAVTSICDRVACLSMHLHYHDTPHHMPADLVYNMFACDLQAMGITDSHLQNSCCAHEHQQSTTHSHA